MEKRSPEFSQISIFGHFRRLMKAGSLQPHIGKWAFCNDIRITFLGSPFPQLPFDIIFSLVQTRYRGKRKTQISSNFHFRPCLLLHEAGYFAAPYWGVRFLHRHKDYMFRLSIPSASFWYNCCLGAHTVPWGKEAPNFFKFPYLALFIAAWKRVIWSPIRGSALFGPT